MQQDTDASGISKEDFKTNPSKLRTDKTLAMAAALIYWRDRNLVTRSGAGEVALRSITYKINSVFAGYDDRKAKLEKAIEALKVKNCPDYKRRKDQNGTVVVIEGKGDHKISGYVVYQTNIYRSMGLIQYKELKEADNLPIPDYITYLSRDAFDVSSSTIPVVKHSNNRYGQYNECPSGEYYLIKTKRTYEIYLGDTISETLIKGSDGDGDRDGIAFHHYSPNDTQGCLTFVSGTDTRPVFKLIDEIPDLFVNKQLKDKAYTDKDNIKHDMSIDQQIVRVILEEREVTESVWENSINGTIKWTGIVDKQNDENNE
ncbi:hypothetical protein J2Q11_13010 [Tenacibaculum finnmarkense genomovar finnmarkense]|uniref:hypothetical protein n=1 Tax=Tenacibaculum finnmarkense TaxID=2781243 RepID=UPI001E3EEC6F|nr:hypothetical protein [Tenacibaculum finnmarkense]MCD8418570.1 hypothetical protein [Tenacibaculum finnmarkense genomovar finnmarkense]MCG8186928.1 hypothetical protein [Tenacibaculum finnmarkense genomovar finnmarkense]MCG8203472.1 hypothetical protein [Tenacibaculum finnmarkense genomovar finnmarkense]MCG8210950.1 hypothetical protein [Tenacibaculum finnmarkense genomovar finnmarkense]MCG8213736.1 hypothetical protein [Tenacibaculum finnmarkense genomovar finnmarkense]